MTTSPTTWRRCSSCKKEIPYRRHYWVCNVSTCNRKRTGLIFCSVACWDAHLPLMNHREAWAEERKAPSLEEWQNELVAENQPKKRTTRPIAHTPVATESLKTAIPAKVLIRRRSGGTPDA